MERCTLCQVNLAMQADDFCFECSQKVDTILDSEKFRHDVRFAEKMVYEREIEAMDAMTNRMPDGL